MRRRQNGGEQKAGLKKSKYWWTARELDQENAYIVAYEGKLGLEHYVRTSNTISHELLND